MITFARNHRIVASLVLSFALCSPWAAASDPAELLPADTLLYKGHTEIMTGEELAQFHRTIDALERYAQTIDGTKPLIEPGIQLISLLAQTPASVGLLDFGVTANGPDLQLAVVVDAGDQLETLTQNIDQILNALGPAITVEETTIDSVALKRVRLPDAPFDVLWGPHDDRLLLTVGEAAARRVIARLNGQGPSLADAAEFKIGRERGRWATDHLICEVYADVPGILARLKQVVAPENPEDLAEIELVLRALGIDNLKSFHGLARRDGELVVLSGFCHVDGPPTGLFHLFEQEPLTDEDVAVIARDPYWAMTWNLDLKQLFFDSLQTVRQIDPGATGYVQMGVGAVAGALGFSSLDQLWSIFGDTWAVYDAPDHGGLVLTGAVLIAEVKDRAGLEAMIERVQASVNTFARCKNVVLTRKETQYGEHTVHYLLVGGIPCPIAPAWGYAGDRWVVGLHPQSVVIALQQADARTRKSSLLDNPEFQLARRQSPPSVHSIGYLDTRSLTRLTYPARLMLGTAAASQLAASGVGFDLGDHPPYPDALARVHNLVATSTRVDDGVLWTCAGSGEVPKLAMSARDLMLAVGLPEVAKKLAQNVAGVRADHIRSLAIGCTMYAVDHEGRFPPSLEEMVTLGLIEADDLRPPWAGGKVAAYRYVSGQEQGKQPRNVLIYEHSSGEEPIHVAFTDGSIQRLEPDQFELVWRNTCHRLGRDPDSTP